MTLDTKRLSGGFVVGLATLGVLAVCVQSISRRGLANMDNHALSLPGSVPLAATARSYEVDLTAVTTRREGDRLTQRVTARLVIARDSGSIELWRLENVTVNTSHNDAPAQGRAPGDVACLVRRGEGARPATLLFSPAMGFEQRRWLEFLIALAQESPGAPGAEPTRVTERDGTGNYDASYLRRPDGAIVRTKLSYDAAAIRGTGLHVVNSEAVQAFEGRQLRSVDAHERLEFQIGGLAVDSSARIATLGPPQQIGLDPSEVSLLTREFAFGQASRESEIEQDVALAQGLTPDAAVDAVLHTTTSLTRRDAVKRLERSAVSIPTYFRSSSRRFAERHRKTAR